MQATQTIGTTLSGKRFAVIGAGIGGVGAALALARRGGRVVLFEQAPAMTEVGAGLQISPNGVAVLEALGVKASAAALASAPDKAELRNARGVLVAAMPLGAVALRRYGQPYWQFHRADLLDCLVQGAAAAGVEFVLGQSVQAEPDGTLNQGGISQSFDLVVASDGVHSAHRKAHFGGATPQFLNHVAWRATVSAQGLPADALVQSARIYMGAGRHLVTYPLRGGTIVNLVGIVETDEWLEESWSQIGDGAGFQKAFAQFGGPVPAMLDRVETCHKWGLFGHAPVPNWVNGRLALLGDACHPTLPFLAQGATQALEDGWQLAAGLAAAQDIDAGLAQYQAARKPRADKIVQAATTSGRLYHYHSPIMRLARNAALRAVSAFAPRVMTRRFDWIYGQHPAD